ncbi:MULTISPECIES: iron-containing alcohol dehydrogenase [Anaerostipes]|uniref:iron-containing alcohol dehydrogenase n=1 Tax=Anaerostipes TaxID=207244 RepID=UPI001C1DE3EC|nr:MULTISPECIES: iron-containing alcohol dehydrogenase [Anaerostipes]MCI5624222.1 iron-containing alcohol dehydrogenase [Anaerostipes sp.]MDY2727132.1 iron-containing alcohol dehydrogenase [Anaerostipes faecalis]
MIQPFKFYMPTKIIFERGAIRQVADEAAKIGKKTLIVTDKPMLDTGLLDPVFEDFKAKNIEYILWSEIVPNPRDVDIERGAAFAKEQQIDSMVAVGGGSAIDTAKAIGAILENGGKCEDWREGNLKNVITPLICVPTTCGTGSEVTHESIVNNTKTLEKDCIWGDEVSAKVAVLDPDVLINLPKRLLASTGMDALTHAVEAYVCKAANPFTDALAETAIRLIGKSLVKAVEENSEEAYVDMMAASCMAGAAFGNSDVASVHSISEALGGYYDIPHGVANAMMLPEVSRLSVPGAPEKYADVARFLGVVVEGKTVEEAAYAGVDYMEELAERLNIPKFCELDVVDPKDFKRLAHTAANAEETFDNPVIFTEADFENLFIKLYKENK